MVTPIPNNVIRPAKELNQLSKHDIEVIKIEQLEQEIVQKQEELQIKKASISYYPEKFKGRIWLSDIMAAVCRYMDFTPSEILGSRRYKELVRARSLFINLSLELTKHGVTYIAKQCGQRDHTTVCYHEKLKQTNSKHWSIKKDAGLELWNDFNKIKKQLLDAKEQS